MRWQIVIVARWAGIMLVRDSPAQLSESPGSLLRCVGLCGLGPNVVFFSTPPYHGTLTRYHAHPAGWAHKLPESVSYEEGSLIEPLAVALAALERASTSLGDPVLIW